MAEFTLSIMGFKSDASKARAVRIIATSEGFFINEDEARELLAMLPATLTFESEHLEGQETIKRLKDAGCDLSFIVDEDVWEHKRGGQFAERSLISDYSEERLEAMESRFGWLPKVFWSLAAFFFVIGWVLGIWLWVMPMMIAAPIQVALFGFAAIGAKGAELWGYVTCLGASLLGFLINVFMLNWAIEIISSPYSDVIGWVILFCNLIAIIICGYLFILLLKKPVRRWFS
ncbi:MAG: hypothetical protein JW941_07835 [Candidatus Coatesbacteria bacterium]|nr:hypothetical protein [Candidatus Coatesbacteria bacterium]